jgi:hypothetical protein
MPVGQTVLHKRMDGEPDASYREHHLAVSVILACGCAWSPGATRLPQRPPPGWPARGTQSRWAAGSSRSCTRLAILPAGSACWTVRRASCSLVTPSTTAECSTNCQDLTFTFRSYSYPHAGPLRSGETTPCIVTAPGGQFVIEDTYWTEDDYRDAIEQAGLTVTTIDYPLPRDPAAWFTDEASVPPCIIIEARKAA